MICLKYFCCCKDLSRGVRRVGQLMPLISISIIFYTFTMNDVVEIGLCLAYAVINVGVNLYLLVGVKKRSAVYLLPWLAWVLVCVTLSTTFAPVMVYAGIHIEYQEESLKLQKPIEAVKFISYGIALLVKAALFIYFWSGVFALFKELRKSETNQTPPVEVEAANEEEVNPFIPAPCHEYMDDPPAYVIALQELKYSFDYEAPPTYFDAVLISQDEDRF